MHTSQAKPLLWLIPLIIGLAFAFIRGDVHLFFGNHNVSGDKYEGDALQHITGLNYFVQDEWRFPLLDVPHLSFAEGGGNIIYTDSLPLLAIPAKIWFKTFGGDTLPDYYGFWLFLCFLLQPIALCAVLYKLRRFNLLTVTVGSLLAVSLPAFLMRWPHITLCSHFLLLFSIAAYLDGRERPVRGTIFLITLSLSSLLVTAYLFAMVFGFFAVHLIQSLRKKALTLKRVSLALASGLGLVLFLLLTLGFWVPGRESWPASGYGNFSMNLLSPFWPHGSWFFAGFPSSPDATGGQYEGWNYLGLGLITGLVLLLVFHRDKLRGRIQRHPWLFAYALFLCLFAVSHIIYAGHFRLIKLPLPADGLFSQFRSGGRMFWPVAYLLMILIIVDLGSTRRGWIWVLPVITALQLLDSLPHFRTPMWENAGRTYSQSELVALESVLKAHSSVYLLPGYGHLHPSQHVHAAHLQYAASKQGIPISHAYLSRRFTMLSAPSSGWQALYKEKETSALVILIPPIFGEADLLRAGWDLPEIHAYRNLLFASHLPIAEHPESGTISFEAVKAPTIQVGKRYLGNHFPSFLHGKLEATGDYLWTHAASAGILGYVTPMEGETFFILSFDAISHFPESRKTQEVKVWLNGSLLTQWELERPDADEKTRKIRIPAEALLSDGWLDLEFCFDQPESLRRISKERVFGPHGFGFKSLKIVPETWVGDSSQLLIEPGDRDVPDYLDWTSGFSGPEGWGRWTDRKTAELSLSLGPNLQTVIIQADTIAFLHEKHPEQAVSVWVNDRHVADWTYQLDQVHEQAPIVLSEKYIPADGVIRIRFEIEHPQSPAQLGLSGDTRMLGIGLRSLQLEFYQ